MANHFNPEDVAARFRAPPDVEADEGDPIDVCTPEGIERLLDLLARAELPPAALAARAGLSITAFAALVTSHDNLRTLRALTRMYGIYRGAMAARLKIHALCELDEMARDTFCNDLAQARANDVRRKACWDLLRTKEQSPLLATKAKRRTGRRVRERKEADNSSTGLPPPRERRITVNGHPPTVIPAEAGIQSMAKSHRNAMKPSPNGIELQSVPPPCEGEKEENDLSTGSPPARGRRNGTHTHRYAMMPLNGEATGRVHARQRTQRHALCRRDE